MRESGPETEDMRFPRTAAFLLGLVLPGLALFGATEAEAQFPPPPGQSAPAGQSNPFPPPPGAAPQRQQADPFPPPPPAAGQQQQSSPFPPPPGGGAPQRRANPFPPAGQASPFPPAGVSSAVPQTGSFSPGPPRPAGPPPGAQAPAVCMTFPPIREQTEKDGGANKIASDRKASREEICKLFNKFVASESKMVNFLVTNAKVCGVPPDAIKHVRTQHARSQQIRKQVCSAGPGPAAPSLSDALGSPVITDAPPKPGRGTFDTLTGSPLVR
jgi:hypothetical protein